MTGIVASTPAASTTLSPQPGSTSGSQMPGKDLFLKLLVAQLQHQNPLQPMDDQTYITQLAQFNAVEQMQKMNANIETFSATQSIMEAATFLGKIVGYRASSNISDPLLSGLVSSVSWATGHPKLSVDDKEVDLSQIVSVE